MRTTPGLRGLIVTLLVAAIALGCDDDPAAPPTEYPEAAAFNADVAFAWGELALSLTKGSPGFSPPVASRAFGYLGLAFYEALVPGIPHHQTLAGQLNGLQPLPEAESGAKYHWPSVANATLARMARYLYANTTIPLKARIDSVENAFEAQFAADLSGDDDGGHIQARSIARGQSVADAIFIYSLNDGGHEGYTRNFPTSYVPPDGPGLWVPTGPLFQRALQPYWGSNRPFVLPTGDPNATCEPGPPPAYDTTTTSAFYLEANEVYVTKNSLTAEQNDIALFWADDPVATATPPGHSLSILLQVCELEGKDLAFAAEAFVKVGIAVSDAFLACWQTKYEYNLLRPITYILANIDANWTPLIATPPFPEYTSGHSAQSGAAFAVLEELFGASYGFTDHTHDGRGYAPRTFASFDAAAEEVAISRVYAGIHYRAAIEKGIAQGRCVAAHVSGLQFHEPGL